MRSGYSQPLLDFETTNKTLEKVNFNVDDLEEMQTRKNSMLPDKINQ